MSDDHLNQILVAANAAPVGMGSYGTIHLTVIQNQAFMAQVSKVTAEFMKRDGDALYESPPDLLL